MPKFIRSHESTVLQKGRNRLAGSSTESRLYSLVFVVSVLFGDINLIDLLSYAHNCRI